MNAMGVTRQELEDLMKPLGIAVCKSKSFWCLKHARADVLIMLAADGMCMCLSFEELVKTVFERCKTFDLVKDDVVIENVYFGCKSLEEARVKRDLLVVVREEEEEEDDDDDDR